MRKAQVIVEGDTVEFKKASAPFCGCKQAKVAIHSNYGLFVRCGHGGGKVPVKSVRLVGDVPRDKKMHAAGQRFKKEMGLK